MPLALVVALAIAGVAATSGAAYALSDAAAFFQAMWGNHGMGDNVDWTQDTGTETLSYARARRVGRFVRGGLAFEVGALAAGAVGALGVLCRVCPASVQQNRYCIAGRGDYTGCTFLVRVDDEVIVWMHSLFC